MPNYKLTYFNGRGNAELARLAFAVGGKQFEDVRIKIADWPTQKANFPRSVPVLEVDGKILPQHRAICRLIGRECGLMGKTSWANAEVDCILDTLLEINKNQGAFLPEQDQERQKMLVEKHTEEIVPNALEYAENVLKTNSSGKGFLVGSTLTLADLALFDALSYPLELYGFKADKFPKVLAHRKMVQAIPKVADYLKKRQTEDEVAAFIGSVIAKHRASAYTLTYFDGKGRGEVIRMALVYGGLKYKDVRVGFSDWPALKPKMPQGAMPVLEVNGKTVSQTLAILRYVGRECGLYGKNSWEQAEVDCHLDTLNDIWGTHVRFLQEQDLEKKKKAMVAHRDESVPKIVGLMEQALADNSDGKGFLVGTALTIADLALYSILDIH
ncbi:hypothetical protein ScPMuIL_004483 [Solemya velum]